MQKILGKEQGRNRNGLGAFIRENQDLYTKSYGTIISDIVLSRKALLILAATIVVGNSKYYPLSQHFGQPLVDSFLVLLVVLAHPYFLKTSLFKGREYRFTIVLCASYLMCHVMSYWIAYQSGNWAVYEVGYFVLFSVVCAFGMSHPSLLVSAGLSTLFSTTLAISAYVIDPGHTLPNIKTIIMGIMFGCTVNVIMNIVYRFSFYFRVQDLRIRKKAEKITRVLNSVGHAIFQIDWSEEKNQLVISGERSELCARIIGEITDGDSFAEKFLALTNLPEDHKMQVQEALRGSIGESLLTFELNSGLLPHAFDIVTDQRTLKIEAVWSPLCPNETIEGILVSLTDVTSIHQDRQQAEKTQEFAARMVQLALSGRGRAGKNLALLESLLDNVQNSLNEARKNSSVAILQDAFIPLHTIKGNARVAGFNKVALLANEAESCLATFLQSKAKGNDTNLRLPDDQLSLLRHQISLIEKELDGYRQAENALGWSSRSALEIETRTIREILRTKSWRDARLLVSKGGDLGENIELFLSPSMMRIKSLVLNAKTSLSLVARKLGKPMPHILIDDQDLWFEADAAMAIQSILPHLFANSIDHGLESTEERRMLGKDETGTIHVRSRYTEENIVISVADDGRGIIPEKILQEAVKKGLKPRQDIRTDLDKAMLIFENGFSTRDDASDISGRGVGTSAVRETVESLGGSVQLVWLGAPKDNGYRSFAIELILPLNVLAGVDELGCGSLDFAEELCRNSKARAS